MAKNARRNKSYYKLKLSVSSKTNVVVKPCSPHYSPPLLTTVNRELQTEVWQKETMPNCYSALKRKFNYASLQYMLGLCSSYLKITNADLYHYTTKYIFKKPEQWSMVQLATYFNNPSCSSFIMLGNFFSIKEGITVYCTGEFRQLVFQSANIITAQT